MADEKRLMKGQRQGRQECARQHQAARQVAQNERGDIQRLQVSSCTPIKSLDAARCQRDLAADMTRFRTSSHH